MRISVLACAVLCVVAAVGFGPVAPVSGLNDLQCHMGNANETSGICNNGPLDRQFKPTWNKASSFDSESYESDSFRINDVDIRTTAGLGALVDGLVDVHRMTWAATVNAGATGRNVSNTIGRPTPTPPTPDSFLPSLPASFLPLPFRLSYLADGVYVQPRVDTVTPAQSVVYMTLTILYKLKADAEQGVDQPADISNNDGSVEVWLLFQPADGFSLTAAPATVQGIEVASRTSSFGPANTLPNRGLGTYYLARRVVRADNTKRENVTNVLSVASGTTLQSVGGPNAPGTTYQVQKLADAFDAPVLTSLSVPAASGAFLTFTLAAIDSSVLPAPGKMFISQAVLLVKSVTPEDESSTGVAPVATYTLDTSAAPALSLPVGTFVAGTQRLYVRAPGAQWQMVSGSSFDAGTNVVTYSIAGTEFTPQVGSLEMSVQADMPVSSSTGPSSSSSSSAAVSSSSSGVSSSSSAPAAPSSSSSSSSSSSAPPMRSSSSSSSSAAQRLSSSSSSSTAASRPSSSSSSTGPASSSVSSSSSSTAPAELPVASSSSTGLASSSSSTGLASSSSGAGLSSSSTGPRLDGAAASVSTGSIALVVAAAAVAALYA